ncbi:unnamed protein product [Owenia fusiformis]|uniref:Uncharacterized protein n=1 Tax=Owenia fusiformis TaxID=6347 RepID=A0A8J1UAJ4_OWEFU|nr:unnamed protein product [Owenia fusiformis]
MVQCINGWTVSTFTLLKGCLGSLVVFVALILLFATTDTKTHKNIFNFNLRTIEMVNPIPVSYHDSGGNNRTRDLVQDMTKDPIQDMSKDPVHDMFQNGENDMLSSSHSLDYKRVVDAYRTVSLEVKQILNSTNNNSTQDSTALNVNRMPSTALKWALDMYRSKSSTTVIGSEHLECTGDVTLTPVDLRIIVLTQERTKSLQICLEHIDNAEYHGEKVVLDIWIDRENQTNELNEELFKMVSNFKFKPHIVKCVHIQDKYVGIIGQWIDSWKLGPDNKEICVILEDDVDVSPHFYTWLKPVHLKYQHRDDVSGVGLSTIFPDPLADKPQCLEKMKQTPSMCNAIRVVFNKNPVYMYKIPTTWGFSPKISSWRKFQIWYHNTRRSNSTFKPTIDAPIIHNTWFNGVRDMWSMWHIYHCHTNKLYCIFPNIVKNGKFANHRQEKGLHYFPAETKSQYTSSLVEEWKDMYLDLPDKLIHVDYDGSYEEGY